MNVVVFFVNSYFIFARKIREFQVRLAGPIHRSGRKKVAYSGSRRSNSIVKQICPTLNTAGLTPLVSNDETKTQLEEAAVLPLIADIYHYDFSWIPPACRPTSGNEGDTGTIDSGQKTEETYSVLEAPE